MMSPKFCLLSSSWERKCWLVSRMLISVLGPGEVGRETAVLKLVVEEIEPESGGSTKQIIN